jgi:NAD(P)-dependent dehydrogenase (short-subunit alcohol dehydrogenase family)
MESVIITGACGGIGRELVREYTAAGYHVIAIDISNKIEELSQTDFLQFDISKLVNGGTVRANLKESVLALIGKNNLKAIVNNAAIQKIKNFQEIDANDWRETLEVNLLAPFFFAQMFVEELSASGGSIVNVSSIHASQTKPGFSVYATSKAALSALTKLLAIEIGSKVRVNAIEPGAISTQMLESGFKSTPERRHSLDSIQPMKRIGQPSEVARLAVFLTSDKSCFINGSAIAIDGGIRNQLHDPL